MDLAARRAQLIGATLQVMRRGGVAAVTTRAICTEAGMALGAFHYTFHHKAELFEAVLDRDLEAGMAQAWRAVDATRSAKDNLHAVFAAYWRAVEEDPRWQLVLSELTAYCLRHPELEHIPARDQLTYRTLVREQLERYVSQRGSEGRVDIETLSYLVVAGLEGITSGWMADGDGARAQVSLAAFADMLASTFFSGVSGD